LPPPAKTFRPPEVWAHAVGGVHDNFIYNETGEEWKNWLDVGEDQITHIVLMDSYQGVDSGINEGR
jgi:hypothetical protein